MRITKALVTVSVLVGQLGCALVSPAPPDPTASNLALTVSRSPLPREAFKATLSPAYPMPESIRAGERVSVHVMVRNSSKVIWPSGGQSDGKYLIRLAARWLSAAGPIEDARALLNYDLAPSDEAEVLVSVTAPASPGEYILEFDLVQEQVSWFGEMGSETLRIEVKIV